MSLLTSVKEKLDEILLVQLPDTVIDPEQWKNKKNNQDIWREGIGGRKGGSPGTVMIHAAYAPLTDPAMMRSGRSVGFTAAANRPALTALRTRTNSISLRFCSPENKNK